MRRLAYNAIVLGVGFASFCGLPALLLSLGSLKGGEDVVEPMVLIAASFLMNFAYTAGPALELIVNTSLKDGSKQLGPGLLKFGLIFSLGVVLLPSVLCFIAWSLTL